MTLKFVLYDAGDMSKAMAIETKSIKVIDAIEIGTPLHWLRIFITDGKQWVEWSMPKVGSVNAVTEHLDYCMEMHKALYT